MSVINELTIIVPTKDRGDIFFRSLEAMVNSTLHINAEIIVINNSIIPITLPHEYKNVQVYDNLRNKNNAPASRNYGASMAKASTLLFVDDDIIITKESIDFALKFLHDTPSACLNVNWEYPPDLMQNIERNVFGRYLVKYGFTSLKGWYGEDKWVGDRIFMTENVASYFFCIGKEDFIKIGRYKEDDMHEGNDLDLSESLRKGNINMYINPLVMVYHNEADRTNIENWLERKKRNGSINRNSEERGYKIKKTKYSAPKRISFSCIYQMRKPILYMLPLLNMLKLDSVGFLLINALLGSHLYHGYNSVK